jgi:DNA-binding response OmpR family regulator
MQTRNANILIVDDNEGTRRLVRMLLKDIGVRDIAQASRIDEAMQVLFSQDIDLIFTDWEMIDETGMELVQQVRRSGSERLSQIPIIMMTAHGEEWRVKAARDAGITDFLLKPIVPALLDAKLRAALLCVREFIRTDSYCGPDRRRGQRAYAGPDRRAATADAAPPERPAHAEVTMDRLRSQFETFLDGAAAMMNAELQAAGTQPEEALAHCQRIFHLAHNLKGQGSSFGYPLVTEIAGELCEYLRKRTQVNEHDLALVGGYAVALDTVARNRVTGDGGPLGQRIVQRLQGFAAR